MAGLKPAQAQQLSFSREHREVLHQARHRDPPGGGLDQGHPAAAGRQLGRSPPLGAPSTVHRMASTSHALLQYALNDTKGLDNPADELKLPEVPRDDLIALTLDD
jgi:hypothetical protein